MAPFTLGWFTRCREIAESDLNPGNWGWGRRKRSALITAGGNRPTLSTVLQKRKEMITITKDQANQLLNLQARGSVCFR